MSLTVRVKYLCLCSAQLSHSENVSKRDRKRFAIHDWCKKYWKKILVDNENKSNYVRDPHITHASVEPHTVAC